MDGLMTEAADLILSNNQNSTKDVNEVFKFERRKSAEEITDVNSITLLRMSITKSLKERSQSEVIDSSIPKRRKSRRKKGSYSRKPEVNVQFLNCENKIEDNCKINKNSSTEDENKLDVPDNVLTKLFTEEYNLDEKVQTQFEVKQDIETVENVKNNFNTSSNDKEVSIEHNFAEIGLKLAQRQFSENIFQNCSTYSLTSDVLQENENHCSSKKCPSNACELSNGEKTNSDSDNFYLTDNSKREITDNDNISDEQISLKDSFFANINNDDKFLQNSLCSNNTNCQSMSRKSSMFSVAKVNRHSIFDELSSDNEKWQQKRERKLSKKEKKKQKKNKSNDIPTYDCPKCGVSYILSNDAARSAACCLHCDFWKSEEPVFLKREKQPWNTCRIS